jgi:uncharacterized protein YjcR
MPSKKTTVPAAKRSGNGRQHGGPAHRIAGGPAHAGKAGGQPGNKNAQKHGFYSKHFSSTEQTRLSDSDLYSVESDIQLLRVYVSRISELVPLSGQTIKEDDLKALNTLSLMTQSISTMIRTHYLTKGKGGTIHQTIEDALEEIRLSMGL